MNKATFLFVCFAVIFMLGIQPTLTADKNNDIERILQQYRPENAGKANKIAWLKECEEKMRKHIKETTEDAEKQHGNEKKQTLAVIKALNAGWQSILKSLGKLQNAGTSGSKGEE